MDITNASPAEIDSEISRIFTERVNIGVRVTRLRRSLGQAENKEAGYGTLYLGPPAAELRAQIDAAMDAWQKLTDELAPLDREEARRGGWNRYYLVPNGHLHNDTAAWRCSRIPATDHYWMTEFSGLDVDEVIAQAGERVCTTCFPDAPVAPRPAAARFMTPSEAERDAYREQSARNRAARKAAQITTPAGAELRTADGYGGDLIKTEVAARRRALADASDIAFYGTSDPATRESRETVDRMVAALARHTGTEEGALRAEINSKVAKKAKREGWQVKATI